jgi:hypothetical protein
MASAKWLFALGLILTATPSGCSGVPPQPAARHILQNGLTTGCYNVGDQQLVLVSSYVTGVDNTAWASWDGFINRFDDCSVTALWDNKWYWNAVPSWDGGADIGNSKMLMLGWKNITARSWGYVVVERVNNQFYLWRLPRGREPIPEGGTITTSWHTNGHPVVVTVHNPVDGQGGWDPNDIRFKFSD